MLLVAGCGNNRAGSMDAGSITHDAYQKALDRLLCDLWVERSS
jgi:hypothetical protein